MNEKDRPLLIVLSACDAGHSDLIRSLSEHGCRYCIAPVFPTNWEHAAIFSTFFYTYLFLRRNRPVIAYHKTIRSLPALTGKWTMFDRGKEIPENIALITLQIDISAYLKLLKRNSGAR